MFRLRDRDMALSGGGRNREFDRPRRELGSGSGVRTRTKQKRIDGQAPIVLARILKPFSVLVSLFVFEPHPELTFFLEVCCLCLYNGFYLVIKI
jgi:hypothetical protein